MMSFGIKSATRILAALLLVCSTYFFLTEGKESYPFYGDSMGYYMYLPSTFIYHNHKALDWLPEDKYFDKSVRDYLQHVRAEKRTPKGYLINKYTYGVAALEMPFFFIAHFYEKITGGTADGYSFAYRCMLKLSSIIYALLGLILVYKILKQIFGRDLSLAGTMIIFLGTNLFWFALWQAGMAHVPVFFLYALLVYCTMLAHKAPRLYLFVVAGLAAGLITVIRPSDIICLFIPLLYDAYNTERIKQKISFLRVNIKGIVMFALAFIIPLLPQVVYWKKFAGSFLYYSYNDESFNWLHPKIFEGLFSFHNGWLIYSPIMILSVVGFVLYKRIRPFMPVLLLITPLYIYIVYSWYCYNYINGLGSRPMIHLYPLLAIPLTALLQYIYEGGIARKVVCFAGILFFISVNISYSFQQAKGLLFSEESNSVYNLHMLYKMKAGYSDLVMYDVQQVQPEESDVEKVSTLACENYEDSLSGYYTHDSTGKSKYVYHMPGEQEYHDRGIVVKYSKQAFPDATWVKCSGRFLCTQPYAYYKHLFVMDILRKEESIAWHGCKIDNKIGLAEPGVPGNGYNLNYCLLNKWGRVYFFVKLPEGLQNDDLVRLYIWNIGKQEIYFDDICLELYRDKK